MFEPNSRLKEYISLVTLDFIKPIYSNKSRIYTGGNIMFSIENKRKNNTRIGIIALIKLYKDIPLSLKEQELLDKYPLENDYKTELERCIAYIAFKIGDEAWEKANTIRLNWDAYERENNFYTYLDIDKYGNITSYENRSYSIKVSPSDACSEYLEYLDEYNDNLRHAWAYNHGIALITLNREHIKPVMNFDSECLIEVIPKTNKLMSLVRKMIKK